MFRKVLYLFVALAILANLGRVAPAFAHTGSHDPTAADLRVVLASQLSEHILLASSATGAALAGRQAQFEAVAAALDGNSVDISRSIGLVYGAEAEQAFLELWRKHINIVVDYTSALAAKDQARADQAVNALLAYTGEIATFLNTANPNLPQADLADMVKIHILTLKDVIDAQAAGDQVKVYTSLRVAYDHMGMLANPIARAISQQFPDRFGPVSADDPCAGAVAMHG